MISGKGNESTNENVTKKGKTIVCEWHNAPLTTTDGKVFGVVSMMLDVTEQKKTENELKQSQQMLQNIIDLLPVRIFWKDSNLNYLGSNKAFAKDAGWKSPADLTGKDDFQMVWKEHANLYREDDAKVIKSGISKLDYEEPLTTPTGEESWINTNKVPLKNDKGKITGVLGTYVDITDRKNIEKKLEERKQLLDEAQRVAGLGVYKTDFIKNRWESSEILDGIFGIDEDYVRSVDGWASLIHPEDRKMMTEYLQNEVFAKKHDFDKEYRIVQKNSGETRWVSGLGKMTFDKQNKPLTMVGTIQDITGRKTVDDVLKQNEERYRTLINVAPLCIKWFDSEGNLVSVNRHGQEEHFLVGKSDEEIKNWKYMECIEEKYRDLVKESMQKALVSGKSSEFDMEHVPGTSTGHWCHSYLVPAMDDKGKVKYVLFISRDFTAEKIAEDEKNKNLDMLEKFKDLTVGRELRMIELKKKIEELTGKKDSTE